MQRESEWATVGRVVAPFGVRGEIKVFPLTDNPNRFAELEAVYLGPSYKRYRIEGVRPYKGQMVLLKLQGFNDISAVEALRDRELQIPVSELPELPPDSYYQHDILDLRVYTLSDRYLGTISDILLTGGNDVYAIKTPEGREVLIPAIKQIIRQIDLIRRTMYIEPIPGLLDEGEAVLDSAEIASRDEEIGPEDE